MPTLALILYAVVALGLLGMAAKFGLGPVPAPHHAAALAKDSGSMAPGVEMVLRGLYQAMAGSYLGLAVLVAFLAYGPIRNGTPGVALALGIAGICAGVPAAYRAWRLHKEVGVPTPWPAATVLTVLIVVATLLAGV